MERYGGTQSPKLLCPPAMVFSKYDCELYLTTLHDDVTERMQGESEVGGLVAGAHLVYPINAWDHHSDPWETNRVKPLLRP